MITFVKSRRRRPDVVALRRFDCSEITVPGRSALSLLALLFFLERWSDGDTISFTKGDRAS